MSNLPPSGVPAVFLDRDGVMNGYLPGDYVRSPHQLEPLPGAADAVRRLNQAGLPVFLISNQQGVAKGMMTHDDLHTVHAALLNHVHAAEGHIQKAYYCTHHSRERCDCRKPQPGLILVAARENGLDLGRSVFVGDTETDAQAARAAGVGAFVLVLTGKCDKADAANPELFPVPPDWVAANLATATDWILSWLRAGTD